MKERGQKKLVKDESRKTEQRKLIPSQKVIWQSNSLAIALADLLSAKNEDIWRLFSWGKGNCPKKLQTEKEA